MGVCEETVVRVLCCQNERSAQQSTCVYGSSVSRYKLSCQADYGEVKTTYLCIGLRATNSRLRIEDKCVHHCNRNACAELILTSRYSPHSLMWKTCY